MFAWRDTDTISYFCHPQRANLWKYCIHKYDRNTRSVMTILRHMNCPQQHSVVCVYLQPLTHFIPTLRKRIQALCYSPGELLITPTARKHQMTVTTKSQKQTSSHSLWVINVKVPIHNYTTAPPAETKLSPSSTNEVITDIWNWKPLVCMWLKATKGNRNWSKRLNDNEQVWFSTHLMW